jgi:cystathionine beta-lyase/cystathionine gamma-synthase
VDLIVDSSFASPAVLRPIGLGASVVVHSATKFISGHGDVTAGVVVGSRAVVGRVRAAAIRVGTNLGAFDAWLAARGLRTLHVRLERQCANALTLARFLEGLSEVERVYYPGLPSHPQHGLAARLFKNGAGAMLSFDLGGGAPAVERLMKRLRLIEFAPSFGDVATTWTYPARTSHRRISDAAKAEIGIGPGLVRLSVGIEAVEDLIDDLTGAIEN